MKLAVEAAHSRELPTFLAGLARRAAELLQAKWGGLGEILGNRVELHQPDAEFPASVEERTWVEENVVRRRSGLEVLRRKQNG
ncbi:MAG TPA: hypothetical protein VED66_11750, partial [Candidatus Sulfotelmatobacter sp.]|nr:hypothetical protein [Candidatus Sulfotelmatobacter sp.]